MVPLHSCKSYFAPVCGALLLAAFPGWAEPFTPIAVWKMRHFTPEQLAKGMGADLAAPAGDEISNLLKYSWNLPPLQPSLSTAATGDMRGGSAELTFSRIPQASDILYTVEASADLSHWQPAIVDEVEVIPSDDGTEQVTVRDRVKPETRRYLRLRVDRRLTDSDDDLLDDDWELRNFSNLAENGADDYDEDGITNAAELVSGSSPHDYYNGEPLPVDQDSAAYTTAAGVVDPSVQDRITEWILGLKRLGLYSRAVSMISLVDSQNPGTAGLRAITGPTPMLIGNPHRDSTGLHFTGQGTEHVAFHNPLRTTALEQVSIFAVFKSTQKANQLVAGNFVWEQLGPSLLAGGSPYSGADPSDLFFDLTTDGITHVMPSGGAGQRTYGVANAGVLQTACASFSTTVLSLQGGYDRRYETTGTFQPAWNDSPEWRIGLNNVGGFPFSGVISFVAVFDTALSDVQYQSVRRLYQKTLGSHLDWPFNAVMEGDSLTSESSGIEWTRQLRTLPNWKNKFSKRNVAMDGESIDKMLGDFASEVRPLAREPNRKYLFLWAGRNGLSSRSPHLLQSLRSYWLLARNAGFKVVAFTILPAQIDDGLTSEFRQALNASIRNDRSNYDHLIDVASLSSLSDPSNRIYYLPDGIHLNSAGHREVANLVDTVIPAP